MFLIASLSFAFPPYGTPVYPSQFISFNITASPHLCTVDSKYFYRLNLAEKGSLHSGTSEVCIWDLEKKKMFATIRLGHRLKAICAWNRGFYAVTETNKKKDCLYYCDVEPCIGKGEGLQRDDFQQKTSNEIKLLNRCYVKSSSASYQNIKIECYSGFKEPLDVLTFGDMLVIPCKTPKDWDPSFSTQDRIKLNVFPKTFSGLGGKGILTLFVDSKDDIYVGGQRIFMLLKSSSKLVQVDPSTQAIQEYSIPENPLGVTASKREVVVYYEDRLVIFSINKNGELDYSSSKTMNLEFDWRSFMVNKKGYYFAYDSPMQKARLLRCFDLECKTKDDLIYDDLVSNGDDSCKAYQYGDFLYVTTGQGLFLFGLQENKYRLFSALGTPAPIGYLTRYKNEMYANVGCGLIVFPCYPEFDVVKDLIIRKRYLSYFSKVELSEPQKQELKSALQCSRKSSRKNNLILLNKTNYSSVDLLTLPDEVHMLIMSYLTPCDLARYGMSCKGLRQLSQDKILQPVQEYYLSLARMAIGWNIVLNDDLETTKTEDQKAEDQKLLEQRNHLREGFFRLLLRGVSNKDKIAIEVAQFLMSSAEEREI